MEVAGLPCVSPETPHYTCCSISGFTQHLSPYSPPPPPPSAPFFYQTVRQCGALTERKGSGSPANENTPTDCPTSHVRSEAGKALTVQRQSRLGKAGAMTGIVSHHGAPSPVRPHLNTQDALASHWDSGLSRLSTLEHTGRFGIPLGFRLVSSVHT